VFRIKPVFIFGTIVFEIGSLICTVAPSSKIFVLGRAVAGLGASAMGGCVIKLLRHLFPLSRQAIWTGVVGAFQSVGLVIAPLIGGVLIDRFGMRFAFFLFSSNPSYFLK
jgi:MFS family permease